MSRHNVQQSIKPMISNQVYECYTLFESAFYKKSKAMQDFSDFSGPIFSYTFVICSTDNLSDGHLNCRLFKKRISGFSILGATNFGRSEQ